MRCLAREFQQRGASATVINFRHCARDPERPDVTVPNRLFRLYHSGYTADLGHVVNLLRGREPKSRLGAVAISMGGNVLLKWLGENPQEHALDAAATISSPFDLETASRHLESRMGRFYAETYLRTLRPKVEGLARRFPVEATWIDPEKLRRIRGFWGYDHHVTAPLHGFASARDYYTQSSCGPYLRHILVPTLCVNAADDPFMAPETLELARGWASPTMTLLTPARGGHVGFLMGPHPWRVRCWSEEVVVDWVLDHLTANR
jgi:predicted alpha/beta-fold hydrolase